MAFAADLLMYSSIRKMSTGTPTESTPLTSTGLPPQTSTYPGPSFVFPGVSARARRRQLHQFQCCLCSIFLIIALFALIVAVSYSGDDANMQPTIPPPNDTLTNDSLVLDSNQILEFIINLGQPLKDEPATKWSLPLPKPSERSAAENFGIKALGDREIFEENSATTPKFSAAFRHFRSITTTPEARKIAKRGYVEYHATFHLAKLFNYTKSPGRSNIGHGPKLNMTDPSEILKCNFNSWHRNQNGTCNNKKHARLYGAAMQPLRRALAPDYSDGISKPRTAKSGKDLPSARKISVQVHRASYPTDSNFTVMLAVYGQFLDHDITATALNSADGQPIDCCTVSLRQHPECYPVPIEHGDPYYDQYNLTCMNFVRSVAAPTGHFGPRQQLNQATSFIDGSVVYGNTDQKQSSLRALKNGTLRMYKTPDNRELLPISTNPDDGCNRMEMNIQGKYCFESGDDRANENLHLTSMHLIFARHHNYLARNLAKLYPGWDDEWIFQEARKILGAQMQHITYNEFLPVLFGEDFIKAKGLKSDPSHTEDTYDPNVNPNIANSFAAAAFRFAHTLIPGLMKVSNDNTTEEYIELHRMLFNPFSLWEQQGVDKAISSAIVTPISEVNPYFSKELSEKLFQGNPNDKQELMPLYGLDLVTLNIQRGRDHGLPSYQEYRKLCGLPSATKWNDMFNMVDSKSAENMKKIYESPEDVDVYTGALSEPPLKEAIFGPLLACLVSDQFIRIKKGDSFWYERRTGPQKFSDAQLNEIYKTTLAGIICRNSDNVYRSQKYVMQKFHSETNPYCNCSELMDFNFSPWSEEEVMKIKSVNVKFSRLQSFVKVVKNINETIPINKL